MVFAGAEAAHHVKPSLRRHHKYLLIRTRDLWVTAPLTAPVALESLRPGLRTTACSCHRQVTAEIGL